MTTAFPDAVRRRAVWDRILTEELLERLRAGGPSAARQYVARTLEEELARTPVPEDPLTTRAEGVTLHGGRLT